MIVNSLAEVSIIEQAINDLGPNLSILEAGCGRRWPLNLSVNYQVVGIDVDETALRIRQQKHGDLVEYKVGSICDDLFEPNSFDVIYCSYVLEHVAGVDKVLENFARWLKPNGLIVIRVPDDRSVYGWLSKHTPHWFHVLACRLVLGRKTAGQEGYGPYPVVYEQAMSLSGLRSFAESKAFRFKEMKTAAYLRKNAWLKPFVAAFSIASLGFLKWRHGDFTVLMRS